MLVNWSADAPTLGLSLLIDWASAGVAVAASTCDWNEDDWDSSDWLVCVTETDDGGGGDGGGRRRRRRRSQSSYQEINRKFSYRRPQIEELRRQIELEEEEPEPAETRFHALPIVVRVSLASRGYEIAPPRLVQMQGVLSVQVRASGQAHYVAPSHIVFTGQVRYIAPVDVLKEEISLLEGVLLEMESKYNQDIAFLEGLLVEMVEG